MRQLAFFKVAGAIALACAGSLPAQTPASPDSVLRAMWAEGTQRSMLEPLAFSLLDSIGARLTGTPGLTNAQNWITARYGAWNISAKSEQYGTWEGWQRGVTHLDLLEPRVRSLDARLLAYSTGLQQARSAKVFAMPSRIDSASVASWLRAIAGNFVLISPEPASCRPTESWERWSGEPGAAAAQTDEHAARSVWMRQVMAVTHQQPDSFFAVLERARPAALLSAEWSGGWGASRVLAARSGVVPSVGVGCEDYGLLYRLAHRSTPPAARLQAESRKLGRVPARNTIAEIAGAERRNETVILSAHLDSWDGGSGATDNGSGTLIVMEAMRILRAHYPRPRRTIVAAHWGGEEQGLNGSKAFVADHSAMVDSLQILFNQDNGSGRIAEIALQGFTGIGVPIRGWLAKMPRELTDSVRLNDPGSPHGGSDFQSFACRGIPAIALGSVEFDYNQYTWHTTLDTYDKLSFGDLRRNATMLAMLAYLAAEEPERLARSRATESVDVQSGIRIRSAPCQAADRDGSSARLR